MTDKTYSRRLAQLISQVENHPNRDEIITLALEQIADDSTLVPVPANPS